MMEISEPEPRDVKELYARLASEAEAGGYHLNPDEEITRDLVEALVINNRRYGYPSCPCRLADGQRDKDLDIICPCDYRDPDLAEFGACYCALYVSDEIARGQRDAEPIPERRGKAPDAGTRRRGDAGGKPDTETRGPSFAKATDDKHGDTEKELEYPVWRCPVCGYLCAREHPPEKCPICKADGDRFKKFL